MTLRLLLQLGHDLPQTGTKCCTKLLHDPQIAAYCEKQLHLTACVIAVCSIKGEIDSGFGFGWHTHQQLYPSQSTQSTPGVQKLCRWEGCKAKP